MLDYYEVEVTEDDVRRAEALRTKAGPLGFMSSRSCPVALAVKRATGAERVMLADSYCIFINDDVYTSKDRRIDRMIHWFDSRGEESPELPLIFGISFHCNKPSYFRRGD